jgi:uncharacterized protein YndB with AHSA1/START domain
MELTINGSPAEVWNALTEKIGEWWPDDFYAGGTAGKRGFRLDTQPGGHMHEHWENGGGALWGTVVASEPEKCLQVLGNVFPNWGGPCQWYGTWQLAPEGKQTRLSFSESAFGRISENVMDEKDKGWKFLWASLKAHVEGRPAPDWGEQ